MNGDLYRGKLQTAAEAASMIRSGQRVFVGSGAASPLTLVRELASRSNELADTELIHLLTLGELPSVEARHLGRLRHNALFIGPNVREAVRRGWADYTPCFLSEVPAMFRSGRMPLDAALVMTTPPDKDGFCSLGVSVDVVKAAVESAPFVVAQVNPNLPWTLGDSTIAVDQVEAFVLGPDPLPELPLRDTSAAALWIGRYVASLVPDGATLQLGIGSVPDAVLASLSSKRDLGVHSEMISDGAVELMRRGVINGRRKTLLPGKIVASFCLGSSALYKAVERNAAFEFRPSDFTNDPAVIALNDRMVAINSALQIDLTGQVAADSIGSFFYSGVGGQVDFIRGAARAREGRSIIVLPSTVRGGEQSRITPTLSAGTGVVTTRADVDFVVSEYGIASLRGKTIRERAVALIQIAHPRFREGLKAAAERLGYLDAGHVLPLDAGPYLVELERRAELGGRPFLVRPLKPTDERRLKDLFYSQSPRTTYLRFGMPLKRLSERQFQELVALDCRNSMAIGAFVREAGREQLVAVARYYTQPDSELAEAAVTVHDAFQGLGLGTFLLDYLSTIAAGRGLQGFTAQVMRINEPMRRVVDKVFGAVQVADLGEDGVLLTALFKDRREAGLLTRSM